MKREKLIVCSNIDKKGRHSIFWNIRVSYMNLQPNRTKIVKKISFYVTTAKMDNVYVVEPNLNTVGAPNTIVVLERNEEHERYPNRLAVMCNEKLGFGQFLWGGFLMGVGFAQYRDVPYGSETTEMCVNLAGGFLVSATNTHDQIKIE